MLAKLAAQWSLIKRDRHAAWIAFALIGVALAGLPFLVDLGLGRSWVRVLNFTLFYIMLAPYKGRVYDPCCGSGSMFVSSEKFIEAHSGKLGDISIHGHECTTTARQLTALN